MKTKGFLPCCPEGAHTLILGSFPSVKSRETDFYYGHPRNRFWATLAEYFSSPVPVTVEDKKSFLAANGIALWVDNGNLPAVRLYESEGFRFVSRVELFYEDTGLTDFLLYEYAL